MNSPATIITSIVRQNGRWLVRGVSHDNGEIVTVSVNGRPAERAASAGGVVDWQATLDGGPNATVTAFAKDQAGNVEQTAHRLRVDE